MADAVDVRIPITLLTGFLGSGKTTVLNNLLKPSFWERLLRAPPLTAVIMNEFGSIGLDHQLVDNTHGTMALLSGGCVCCEIQGSLVPTLKNLWMGRRDGKIPPYERIIIETTGIADPTPILETLLRSDWVAKRHYLDGVVTTVDAVFGSGHLDQHFYSRSEQLSGRFLKIRFQQTVNIIPDHTACLGYETIATRILLYEFQIAMSRRIGTNVTQLRLYPIFIGQALLQAAANKRIQF